MPKNKPDISNHPLVGVSSGEAGRRALEMKWTEVCA